MSKDIIPPTWPNELSAQPNAGNTTNTNKKI